MTNYSSNNHSNSYFIFKKFIDLIFPPKCLNCDCIIESIGGFCEKCWLKIDFISKPSCYICSYPFEYNIGEHALCASCIKEKPYYEKAVSIFKYNDNSKKIIHGLKFLDKTYFAPYLGNLMHKALHPLDQDIIAPIPIHKFRLLKRFYNQSLLLAQAVSNISGVTLVPDLLLKVKNTIPQSGLTKKQRQKNIKNAYILNPKYKDKIVGKKILLVDDVITTGSTANLCAKILVKAEVKKVELVTLAKTVFN
ncbi:MAG: ComF family protein [Alphaproteobacteria bacterium]